MKNILWSFVLASVAVNGWLLTRPSPAAVSLSEKTSAPASVLNPARPASAVPTKFPAAEAPAETKQRISKLVQTIVSLDSSNPESARDQLRAAGADDATVYAVIDGMFRLKYYQAKRLAEIENIKNGWWRGGTGSTSNPKMPLWGKTVVDPMLQIAGYDPHDLVDLASRFDFLPPEKAQVLAKMSVDYFAMHLRFTNDGRLATSAASELMQAERGRDLANLLTPQEHVEYDLRFSAAADENTVRFARMPDLTEAEYRAIVPILSGLRERTIEAAGGRGAGTVAGSSLAVQQQALDDIVAAVGYDRAADYLWAGANVIVRSPNNPDTLIGGGPASPRMMQLAAETGAQAAAIHADDSRSVEEKRAALLALQQATQPKLEKLLPPEGRSAVDPQSLGWFDVLAKVQYVTLTPRLAGGAGTTIVQPTSVTAPVRLNAQQTLTLRPTK